MTSIFNKTISGDFTSGLDSRQFHTEIDNSSIVPVLQDVGIVGNNVTITFDSGLSAGEETTLDTLISNHVPNNYQTLNSTNWNYADSQTYYSTYTRVSSYDFPGTDYTGSLRRIVAYCYKDSAVTNFDLRIYDTTNEQTICEVTNQTNTDPNSSLDMGTISNLSTGSALWEVQCKKNGGGTNDDMIYLKGVSYEY